jgi:RNA polymerase sigma-70 factor (ECF subfamily)
VGPEPMRALVAGSHGFAHSWRGFESALLGARARLAGMCGSLTRSREDAEDLASETVLRALRYRAAYDGVRPIEGWLYQIAMRIYLTSQASQAEGSCLDSLQPVPEQCLDPAELYDRVNLSVELMNALDGLTRLQRNALTLAALRGLSVQQTATELGLSREATKSLLKRAKARARKELRRGAPTDTLI